MTARVALHSPAIEKGGKKRSIDISVDTPFFYTGTDTLAAVIVVQSLSSTSLTTTSNSLAESLIQTSKSKPSYQSELKQTRTLTDPIQVQDENHLIRVQSGGS